MLLLCGRSWSLYSVFVPFGHVLPVLIHCRRIIDILSISGCLYQCPTYLLNCNYSSGFSLRRALRRNSPFMASALHSIFPYFSFDLMLFVIIFFCFETSLRLRVRIGVNLGCSSNALICVRTYLFVLIYGV